MVVGSQLGLSVKCLVLVILAIVVLRFVVIFRVKSFAFWLFAHSGFGSVGGIAALLMPA